MRQSNGIAEAIKKAAGLFYCPGARDETRTHNPVKEADFKSAAYTNSATRATDLNNLEVRTRVALVYAVLQTAA